MSALSDNSTLLEPRLLAVNTKLDTSASSPEANSIECSIHHLPKPLMREFLHVFGENYKVAPPVNKALMAVSPAQGNKMAGFISRGGSEDLELLAIPTNQRARLDLVAVGDDVENEKDRLLNVFIAFGTDICKKLRDMGYWADYMDPCSGLPMLTPNCSKVYSEVDGMEVLLGYRAYNAGFCKILVHPQWGSSVYPATVFARAPFNVVKEILASYPNASV